MQITLIKTNWAAWNYIRLPIIPDMADILISILIQSEADYTSRIMEEVSGELSFAGTKIKVAAPAVGESARYVRNIFCHTSTSVTGMQNGEVLHVYA